MSKFFIIGCVLILAGCSSMNPFKDGKVELEKVKGNEVPEWFLSKEESNSKHITVTATDVSKDMQFAIDKATMNAKIQIASKLKTDVQSLARESSVESGYGVKDVEREIDRVSKTRVNQSIGFFTRENLAVYREGDYYRAYVMLKISVEDARRLTYKKDSVSREEKFKELDQPVEILPVR